LRDFIFDVYHVQPHSETHVPPQQRWEAGGFLTNGVSLLQTKQQY